MNDMHALHFPDRSSHSANFPLLWFTALFAVVTYTAISTRALLNPYEVNYFIDAKRIFSILIGAGILWLVLRAADRNWAGQAAIQSLAVLSVSAAGVLGLFAAREVYDLATSGEILTSLAVNIRFMLTWTGYFAAAIAGFLALGYYRQLQAAVAQGSGRVEDAAAYPAPPAQAGYEVADIDFDPR
jgi:hypothetical protein